MKKLSSLFLILIVLAVSGCGAIPNLVPALKWTRIPEAPEYTVEAPIPLRVGVIFLRDKSGITLSNFNKYPYNTSILSIHPIESVVIKALQEIQLFDSLVHPYQEGDPVDAVLRLTITEDQEEDGELSRFGVDMLTMFSFGLSRPIVGRSATFTHDALAVIHQSVDEIGRYSVEVSSTVRWEADTGAGEPNIPFRPSFEDQRRVNSLAAGDELQGKRLAFELAKKIRADRQNLLSKLNKSQEETTEP